MLISSDAQPKISTLLMTMGDIRGLLRIKPRQKANIGKVRRHYDIRKRLEGHEVAFR